MKKLLFSFGFMLLFLLNCKKDDTTTPVASTVGVKAGTYLGESVLLNSVKINSFVKFSADDVPSAIGLTLPKASFDHDFAFAAETTLPREALVETPFNRSRFYKGISPNVEKFKYKHGFVIYFDLKSLDFHRSMTSEYQKNGYNSPFFREPDLGIIPAGFKKNTYNYGGIYSIAEPELFYINDDSSLMIGCYNNEIIEYCVLVSEDIMRNNPNISFTVPLTTQKGYFPTKISIIQTGTDINVTLDGLKKVQ
jgi:hypothetical protein